MIYLKGTSLERAEQISMYLGKQIFPVVSFHRADIRQEQGKQIFLGTSFTVQIFDRNKYMKASKYFQCLFQAYAFKQSLLQLPTKMEETTSDKYVSRRHMMKQPTSTPSTPNSRRNGSINPDPGIFNLSTNSTKATTQRHHHRQNPNHDHRKRNSSRRPPTTIAHARLSENPPYPAPPRPLLRPRGAHRRAHRPHQTCNHHRERHASAPRQAKTGVDAAGSVDGGRFGREDECEECVSGPAIF